jgi:hypothetical protein
MEKQGKIELDKLKSELLRVKTTLECYYSIPRNLNRINAYKKQIKCLEGLIGEKIKNIGEI